MTNFHIDSTSGRIGQLWWVNSDPTPTPLETIWSGWHLSALGIRWGTFGFGRNVRVFFETIER